MNKLSKRISVIVVCSLILSLFNSLTLFSPSVASASGGAPQTVDVYGTEKPAWNPGLPNGIPVVPNIVNVLDFGAKGDGVTNDLRAFQYAVNYVAGLGEPGAVYIPEGNYILGGTLNLKDQVVLRGAGADETTLHFNTNGYVIRASGVTAGGLIDVTGGYTKGSNQIIVADAASFQVGDMIELSEDNDEEEMYTNPEWNVTWAANSVGQNVLITAIDGNTLTLSEALRHTYKAGLNPKLQRIEPIRNVGIEYVHITRSDTTDSHGIQFMRALYSWVKGIEVSGIKKSSLQISNSYRLEARDSYFHDPTAVGGGGQGYGVEMIYRTSSVLVENNIFRGYRHAMLLQYGSTGNVFGYNYSREGTSDLASQNAILPDISLHGHYSYENLAESNVVDHIGVADHWGPTPYNTFLRNRVNSHIIIQDHSNYTNVIGSEIYGNVPFQKQPGVVYGINVDYYPKGSVPTDPATLLLHGNYETSQSGVVYKDGLSTEIPASYYLSEKPAFFGSKAWPLIGPDQMDTTKGYAEQEKTIPAQDRWASGTPNWPYPTEIALPERRDDYEIPDDPAGEGWLSNSDWAAATTWLGPGHTGKVALEFDVTPLGDKFDGQIGYAGLESAIGGFSSLPIIIRFTTEGKIDVRNGGAYAALTSFEYKENVTYHMRIEADLSSQTYNVWVTAPGSTEGTKLAENYAFRPDAPAITDIGKLVLRSENNDQFRVSNHVIGWKSFNDYTKATRLLGQPLPDKVQLQFDVVANAEDVDVIIGYADPATDVTGFGDLSMIVRMRPQTEGFFDVRDGSTYAKTNTVKYEAGKTYTVRIAADLTTKKYSVWVKPSDGDEVQIADAYDFRSNAPAMTSVGKITIQSLNDNEIVLSKHKLQVYDIESPTAPTVAVADQGSNYVDLSWTSATDNVGVAGYVIDRNGERLATVGGQVLSYKDTSVAVRTSYTYAVKAVDAAGNESALSNTVEVTTALYKEILLNGGFENDKTSWQGWGNDVMTTEPDQVKSGLKALRITDAGAGGAGQNLSAVLKPNTTYRASAWGRMSEDASAKVEIGVKYMVQGETAEPHHFLYFDKKEWTYEEVVFTTPPQLSSMQFFIWKPDTISGLEFYLDDVSLAEISTLNGNGGFEDGKNLWQSWGRDVVVTETAHVKNGFKALKIEAGGNGGAGQKLTQLLPNTTYKVQAWGKVSDNLSGSTINMGVQYNLPSGAKEQHILRYQTNEWAYREAVFTTPAEFNTAELYIWKGLTDYDFYVDDVFVYEVSPVTEPEEPEEPGDPGDPGDPSDPGDPADPGDPGTPNLPPNVPSSGGSGAKVEAVDAGVKLGIGSADLKVDKTEEGASRAKVTVSGSKLEEAFALLKNRESSQHKVFIDIDGAYDSSEVTLPASIWIRSSTYPADAVIVIGTESGAFELPMNLLHASALAAELGVDVADLQIRVTISNAANDVSASLEQQAAAEGLQVAGKAIEFSLHIEGNGQLKEIKDFGSTYVTRQLFLDSTVDPSSSTVVRYDPATSTFTFVPAVFTSSETGTTVTAKRNGNSVYAVVTGKSTFQDISGHWSEQDVALLAAKQLVKGVSSEQFQPDRSINRAEFVTLLVRALGLSESKAPDHPFRDVGDGAWYAGAVGAALKAKLVEGYEDGTFRPQQQITREELAVLFARAMAYAAAAKAPKTGQIEQFKDLHSISPWARNAVEQIIDAGIMEGKRPAELVPGDPAKRAEVTVMLKRFLQYAQFIN